LIQLRKLHLIVGFTLVPFLLIQAVTGFVQVLGMFPRLVVRLHSWHIIVRYFGLVVATGLAFLAVTGGVLYLSMRVQQWERKSAQRKQAAAKTAQTADRTP
jgi:uncharacterized iron-regulated membrane protein